MVQSFDVYDNKDEKVVTNQPSPVVISGLNPATKYSGYKIAYTGKDAKTMIDDFTTTNQVPGKPSLKAVAGVGKLDVTFIDGQNIGTEITKRTVYWKTADGHNGTADFGASLSGSVNNLTNGTEYTLQGVCTNAAGDSEKSDEVKGTPVAPTVPVTSITADKALTVQVGKTAKINASVTPDNATNKVIIFKSSDPSFATVDEDGTVHGIKATEPGKTVQITSTSWADGSKSATTAVTVTAPETQTPTPAPTQPAQPAPAQKPAQ